MSTIKEGDTLPQTTLLKAGDSGVDKIDTASLSGRVAIFGLPGAFTGTCTNQHLPSFMRNVEGFREKGVERVICITVNDPFVCKAWSDATGAADAGVEVLSDASGALTRAMGLNFDLADFGLIGRCKRFAMLVRDGKVEALNLEEAPGTCELTAGENLLKRA